MRIFRMAAIASVGLLALAGCGSEQGTAMYIGDERVPETTIDGYVDQIGELRTEQGEDLALHDFSGDRQQAVVYALYAELGREIGLEPADTTGAVDEFEKLYLEAAGYYEAMFTQAEPRELTDAEMQAAAEAAATGSNLAGATEAELEMLAGFTDDLSEYVEEYDIRVNPRYGEFDLSPVPGVFSVEIPQR